MHDPRHHLVADRPASNWSDAYPIGNGHLGAMITGHPGVDRLQINDSFVWRGNPAPRALADGAATHLEAAREAVLSGDLDAAEAATMRMQSGNTRMYQPYLEIDIVEDSALGDPPSVRRMLDLSTAIARTTVSTAAGEESRTSTVSAADDVLLEHRILPEATRIRLCVTSLHDQDVRLEVDGENPRLVGRLRVSVDEDSGDVAEDSTRPPRTFEESVHASWALEIRTDGTLTADGDSAVVLDDAHEVELRLSSRTQFALDGTLRVPGHDELEEEVLAHLDSLTGTSHADLFERAARAHAAMQSRLDLSVATGLPRPVVPDGQERTTEALLEAVDEGSATAAEEADLICLLVQMGRYLLITSARGMTPPANLQGIWNQDAAPPWGSDYTTNINLEMNYWPAGPANLVDAGEGLTAWASLLAERGRAVAGEIYDAQGWAVHHNSDRWGFAGPIGRGKDRPQWSFWPLGGAWISSTLVDLHRFSPHGIPASVRDLHVEAVRFVLDLLVDLPDGSLGTVPSTSPENTFRRPGDDAAHEVHVSTASDIALIREAIRTLLAEMPDRDPELSTRARAVRERLPEQGILPSGLLAEWSDPALTDVDPLHRHTSHLIGLYPGTILDPETDPERVEAARRSLEARGLESTGWALAWRICLAARLGDGDLAHRYIRRFLHPVPEERPGTSAGAPRMIGGVHRSLLCSHPPFQIDGNFGSAAGILELLVQSHRRSEDGSRLRIDLLPACPALWDSGRLRGARLRGGAELDLHWDAESVTAVLRSIVAQSLDVRWEGRSQIVDLDADGEVRLRLERR